MAVKKKGGRWTGAKKAGSAAAGKAKAESDRKLQREAEQRRGCHRMAEAGDRHGKEVTTRERLFAEYVARFGERPLQLDDERASDAEETFMQASETLRVLLDRMAAQNDRVNGALRRVVAEQRYEDE